MSFKSQSRPGTFTFPDSVAIPVYGFLFCLFWIYTGITTTNFINWLLENTLTIPFVILLYYLNKWHKFSTVSISLLFIFLMLHVYGSQFTYSENPFGFWLKKTWHLERNHFDRIVHFGFGLLLAYPIHEIARYKLKLKHLITLILPLELTLSLSALYELVEWAVADIFFGTQGATFLGMQGDMWDAQKDIALAFSGACITMLWVLLRLKKEIARKNASL